MNNSEVVITQRIENTGIQQQIWELYKKSFLGTEIICAQNQKCYDEQTFKEALMDPDYFKYYLEIEGAVAAYMLATNNLQKASITYMNPERYCDLFKEYAPDRIYYFTSLAVREKVSFRYLFKLITEGLLHIDGLKGIWAFDFSHETVNNLGSGLIAIAAKLNDQGKFPYKLRYVKAGIQEFGAMVPEKKPTE